MNWQRNSKSYNVNEAFVLDDTFPKGKQEETIRERSDSQSSVEDDDDHVANPRGLPTQAESIDFGLDDDVNKGKPFRDCLMGCFVVFVVLAMTTCVAILLYFILINTVFVESDTKTLTGYTGALTIEGSVLLNETYDPDLADPESMTYRDMENEFLSSMSGSFSNSTLADIYNGTNVERFEQGSIRIVFSVFLLSAPNDADTETEVILEVQVIIGDGIYSGFFDVFDVIDDSLEITAVNQESGTTAEPPIAATEAPLEPSTVSTIYSVTSQLMTSLSTLLSTPVTTTQTVAPTIIPTTTRLFSTHVPTSPYIELSTLSTTSTQSTSPSTSEAVASTSSTVIDNSTRTDLLTTKPTTISPSATYSQTVGTTISTTTSSTAVNMSTTSSPPTIPTTIETVSTTTNISLTKLSTIRQPSTDSPTSKTTPNTTSPSSSSSPTSSTIIDNSTRTDLLTTKPSTISPSATYSQTVGTTFSTTTSSTVVNVSTTSSTTINNSTGTFHITNKLTTIPLSSTSDTTLTTIPSITRILTTTAATTTPPPTITPTIDTVSTTANISLTKLTTIRQPSTDSPTTSAAEMNITRQPKIHPALPDTCGARPAVNGSDSDGTDRIVGGTQSGPGKWPWMGSLRDGTLHQCGAILIHQEWAITAHHCIGFFDNIVLGDNDNYGNTDPSPYRVQRNVQPFSNPDFDTVTDNGDIALLFLTEPVEFNDQVQPLCINTLKTEMTSFNNCFVTGWGTDDFFDQRAMRYLLEASIQMINRSVCSEWYQTFHIITNQHICAGEEDGRRDACSGDSGGPLQCQDDQGIWYLLGVVSFGQNCGNPRLPGVYTRVSTQIDFLSGILDTNIK